MLARGHLLVRFVFRAGECQVPKRVEPAAALSAVPAPPESAAGDDDFWDVGPIVAELGRLRREWRTNRPHHAEYGIEGFPSRIRLGKVMEDLSGVLYPLRLGPDHVRLHNEDLFVEQTLQIALARLHAQVRLELAYVAKASAAQLDHRANAIIVAFARSLPALREMIDSDIEAAFAGDPSARSFDEVLICFPGLLAIIHHRLGHVLHGLGAPLVARIIAEIAHGKTGIDIHPAARIGESFFIDHGTGVVIGETAVIGNRVRLYQGVTLGARKFATDAEGALIKALPRHPTIEDDVVIYAGATILGRITIGQGSEIGGNVWLTEDVQPGSRVVQARQQNLVIRQDRLQD
jgi:serine O-acetyltransferase